MSCPGQLKRRQSISVILNRVAVITLMIMERQTIRSRIMKRIAMIIMMTLLMTRTMTMMISVRRVEKGQWSGLWN